MRKLVILVAAVGLLASCSKETPVAPATPKVQEQQEAPVTLTGEEAGEGQIRLSLTMELDNFEQIAGGFDDSQEPRAVKPTINTGAAGNKLVNLRAYADAGSDRINGMLYVYDAKSGKTVAFNAPFRIYNDGKSIGYDGLVSGFTPGSTYEKNFKEMAANKMANCYVTAIIGNNPGSLNFSNKGPFVINNWDDNVTLPDNFVMLKSESNPIGWRTNKGGKVHEITVQNNGRMKLTMMGYLMMLRIHNGFPQYVTRINPATNAPYTDASGKRYRAPRPAMFTYLDVSPTLSVAQNQQILFDNKTGKFYMKPGSVNTTNFYGRSKEVNVGQPDRYRFMEYKTTLQVPVSAAPAGELPAKGDYVVAMYFPQVDDFGSIGIRRAAQFFYDGTTYSLAPNGKYYKFIEGNDKLEKSLPTPGSSTPYRKALDNKVYYPVISLKYMDINTAGSANVTVLNWYKNWTNGARWELIP